MSKTFWAAINAQLAELKSAKSADDVLRILSNDPGMSSGAGFFAGSGGDGSVYGALSEAGWRDLWFVAGYHWAMQAPDGGSAITYVEGDIYRGNCRPV